MLKILWICNVPLPELQSAVGIKNYTEGWLIGISSQLRKRKDIEFHYAFPQNQFKKTFIKTMNGITFWGFYNGRKNWYTIKKENIQIFRNMIQRIDPDIVHIFGTEYPHSLECISSVPDRRNVVVSLQGLTAQLEKVYVQGIPFADRLVGRLAGGQYQCLLTEKYEFYKRGINENQVLSSAKNVIGRTDWDKNCVIKINPRCCYFHCNETLRDVFYKGSWNIEEIERYSIFVSQGNYPIKGLHVLIFALPLIKRRYPEVMVYVAGDRYFLEGNNPYGKFIKKILKKYHVEENVRFLGFLTGEKVKQRLLKTHIAVMPSLLENSPNSIGEAMLLGVPVVASNVGGIPSIVQDGIGGYLYPSSDRKKLAKRICRIFASDKQALYFSNNGKESAQVLYDRLRNLDRLMEIYYEIDGGVRA